MSRFSQVSGRPAPAVARPSARYRVVSGDLMAHLGPQVVPVNCVPGVMGAGLAKAYADRYGLKDVHRRMVDQGHLGPGRPIIDIAYMVGGDLVTVLFPTKYHWRDRSSCSLIFRGLSHLYGLIEQSSHFAGPVDLGMPALGCGLGSLDFAVVEPMLRSWAAGLPDRIDVTVYRPGGQE